MDLNKVMFIGNVTRDPEIKTTPTGVQVASFGLATNLVWKDQSGQKQERAEFHNIVAWRRLAEIIGEYVHKGSRIYLEGRLQTRTWDDASGNKKYWTEVNADNMILLDRKGAPSQPGGEDMPPPPAEEPAAPAQQSEQTTEEDIKVEDIPF
jgi:single-strand DNA-binding protein